MPTSLGYVRVRTWLSYAAAVAVLLSAACSDQPPSNFVEGPVGPSAQKQSTTDPAAGFYIRHKKNGKSKSYRVKLDPARGTIELETVQTMSDPSTGNPVDWCEPDDPSCVSGDCELTDTTCGLMYGEEEISGQTNVYFNKGEPAHELAEGEYGPYYCPAYIDDPHFVWRGHHFEINGRIYKDASVILRSPSGLPRARYGIPRGTWYSDDNAAVIYSGTIDATCHVQDRRVWGIRVTEGYVTYSNFQGQAKEMGGTAGGSGGGTWVSYGGSGSGSYVESGAAAALRAYLDEGRCTEGWDIYVDDMKVC
jgi:hypothetical protein